MRKILAAIIIIILALPLLAIAADVKLTDPYADGIKLFNLGKPDAAAERLMEAVKLMPNDAALRLTYGVALASIHKPEDAIVQFKEATRIAPDDSVAYFLIEGAYLKLGKNKEAQDAHQSAMDKLGPVKETIVVEIVIGDVPPNAMNRGSEPSIPAQKAGILETEVANHPDNAIAHNLLGNLYQLQGKSVESIAHYRAATQLAPGWFKPWFNLGIANIGINPTEATAALERAVKLDPKNLQSQLWLGDAYAAQRNYDKAIQAYNGAAADKSLELQARVRLGNLYVKQHRLDMAEQEFDKAAGLAPMDPVAATGRAEVYSQRRQSDKSAKEYQRAAMASNSAQKAIVLPKAASIYMQNGEYKKAIDELRDLMTPDQASQEPFRLMAEAYQGGGMLSQGIVENEAMLASNPHNIVAMRFLVAAYALSGNIEKRVLVARKLIKELPDTASMWNCELGAALFAMGDRKGALESWRQALETDPGSSTADVMKLAQQAGAAGDIISWYEKESVTKTLPNPSLILASIYEWQGDYRRAATTMQKLTNWYPLKQDYWIFLGDDLLRARDRNSAKAAYERAAKLNENPTLKAIAVQRSQELR